MTAGRAAAWWAACRPATLFVSLAPVAVGCAIAHAEGGLRLAPSLLALVSALAIQIGTNLCNDLFDAKKGADGPDRLGPRRAVASGLLSARAVKLAAVLSFAVAIAAGAFLVWAQPILLWVGLASIGAGVWYTAGRFALAYVGLGDVFVFVFFGAVALAGTSYVSLGRVPLLSLFASVPVGALATAVLVVNNLRDRESDARAEKRTLVVRFGRSFGLVEYVSLLALAFLAPLSIWAAGLSSPWVLLPLSCAPGAIVLARAVLREDGRALNPRLGHTARLLIAFSALLALGIVA